MITITIIFILLVAVSMRFVAYGDTLGVGAGIGMLSLSAGVIGFVVTGFWIPVAFAFACACFASMGIIIYGMAMWNWKRGTAIAVASAISLITALAVLIF